MTHSVVLKRKSRYREMCRNRQQIREPLKKGEKMAGGENAVPQPALAPESP